MMKDAFRWSIFDNEAKDISELALPNNEKVELLDEAQLRVEDQVFPF